MGYRQRDGSLRARAPSNVHNASRESVDEPSVVSVWNLRRHCARAIFTSSPHTSECPHTSPHTSE